MAAVPIYLGAEEVQGVCLGADEVFEAYLGEDLVYQAGPFVGLRVSPRIVLFNDNSLTVNVRVTSSESWTMTVPAWISADVLTGDTGITVVSLTATTQTAATADTITITSANYSASATVEYSMNKWMFIDSSSFDRSLPITKVRYYMKNVPAGTPSLGATEGCFSECPNKNIDGNASALVDQTEYCNPRMHKFNMVYQGGKYTNGSTAEIAINTLPLVEEGVYELTTNMTVYWAGVESLTTPVYTNGNLVEVYVDYSA